MHGRRGQSGRDGQGGQDQGKRNSEIARRAAAGAIALLAVLCCLSWSAEAVAAKKRKRTRHAVHHHHHKAGPWGAVARPIPRRGTTAPVGGPAVSPATKDSERDATPEEREDADSEANEGRAGARKGARKRADKDDGESNEAGKQDAEEDGEEDGQEDGDEGGKEDGDQGGDEGMAGDFPPSPAEALLVVFGGLDLGGRQFHYNQRITNATLRPFDLPQGALLPVTPGAALTVELYPLASTTWTFARDLGLVSRFGYNLAKARLGTADLSTRWYSWDLALRGRVHLGPRGSSPSLGLEAGWGRLAFTFQDPAGTTPVADMLPGVDYRFLRFGADGRWPMGKLALIGGAGYRHLLTRSGPGGTTVPAAGSVGEHFPRADIQGLDARAGATWMLSSWLEARLVLSYVRFWATFNPRAGDTYIAGGGLDQMLNADLGVAVWF